MSGDGCVSVHSYVEDGYADGALPSEAAAPLLRLRLETMFLVNGVPAPSANEVLAHQAAAILRHQGVVIDEAGTGDAPLLRIVVNDRYDAKAADHDGFTQGLTLGLAGEGVEDRYDFAVSLADGTQVLHRGSYHPTMATTGVTPVPASYGKPYTSNQAFYLILKATVRSFMAEAAPQLNAGR
jgi:hypothetical protein